MFERTKNLLGNKYDILINKVILIIGLGGVGSYALETIIRTGFKKVIIVDNDRIDITNLNRQLMTNQENIGCLKTEAFKERIKKINPDCEVIIKNIFVTKDNLNEVFTAHVDYVIDAVDTLQTKKEIIKYCLNNNIKFISSMGMAKRIDCSKIRVSYLDKTSYDPLAKKLRNLIKKDNIKGKIPVIYSSEEINKTDELGSIAHVPATAGLMCTNYIINDILKDLI